MGSSQSHTTIVNKCREFIKIVLVEEGDRFTTQIIEPDKTKVIPTSSHNVTLHVYRKYGEKWSDRMEASYTAIRGTNFIVDYAPDGSLQIWRSVPGNINEKNEGL